MSLQLIYGRSGTGKSQLILDEIKEISGLDLAKDLSEEAAAEIETLGGFVFNLTQRIPSRGEVIEGPEGLKFQIMDVDPRRIKKVMIIRPKEQEPYED